MPDLTKMMKTSISNVFETAFFQTVEIGEAESDGLDMAAFGDAQLTGARLRFSRGLEGMVYVIAPDRWVSWITADFLGIDLDRVTAAQKEDTIKEAANMIAGHMFSLFDKDGSIQLGIPEMIRRPKLTAQDLSEIRGTGVWVMTDTEKLAVVTALTQAGSPENLQLQG
jgi:chemotaxis protein CheY-P-specific phosphatase CheC